MTSRGKDRRVFFLLFFLVYLSSAFAEKSVDGKLTVKKDSEEKDTEKKEESSGKATLIVDTSKKDSYLEALEHSRHSKDPKEGIVNVDVNQRKVIRPKLRRREYVQGPVYSPDSEYGAPSKTLKKIPRITYGAASASDQDLYSLTPSNSYSLPVQSSVEFHDNPHGVPHGSYGVPQINYGTPSKTYGSPSYPQVPYGGTYGNYPPAQQGYDISVMPSIDFSWPFALKLNAFTLAKILLKLVIFKMIVKFIAVICLLLFIPKLEIVKKGNKDDQGDEEEEEEEEGRLLRYHPTSVRLNDLTATVISSMEKYQAKNEGRSMEKCTSFSCRFWRAYSSHDSWGDYVELFKSYVMEEGKKKKEE